MTDNAQITIELTSEMLSNLEDGLERRVNVPPSVRKQGVDAVTVELDGDSALADGDRFRQTLGWFMSNI